MIVSKTMITWSNQVLLEASAYDCNAFSVRKTLSASHLIKQNDFDKFNPLNDDQMPTKAT